MTEDEGRSSSPDWSHHRTERLVLDRVTVADTDQLHTIHADPRVWTHFPSGRHDTRAATEALVADCIREWETNGIGYWSVRDRADSPVIGIGGCRLVVDEDRWNLYYRFTPGVQGRGYATELARAAVAVANRVAPDVPVVAYMLATNPSSWRVADKIGLTKVWEGPDAGNPDPTAIRYVYADRPGYAV
ncbi:MAG: GNAT family N-acetyltransferase [Actinomycetota bacterium]